MPIQPIHGNEKRHSLFVPAVQGAVIGAGAGLIGKYALPLTLEERLDEKYIDRMKEIEHEKTTYNADTKKFVQSINRKIKKNPAEDTFVKMFDGMQKGETLDKRRIRQAIESLEKDSPDFVPAFKNLCQKSLDVAENIAKQTVQVYNIFTKHIRPTGFFLATGAVAGTFIALAYDIMKTDIKPLSNE